MYNINQSNIHKNIKSKLYIASKIGTEDDDYGNQKELFKKPISYMFNIQPLSESSEIQAFGEVSMSMRVAIISKNLYYNKFKEFDRAYIDIDVPKGEDKYCLNANYRVYAVQNQNTIIKVFFKKIIV